MCIYGLTEIVEITSCKINFLINYLSKFHFSSPNFSIWKIKSGTLPFFVNQISELVCYLIIITTLRLEFIEQFSWKFIYYYAVCASFFCLSDVNLYIVVVFKCLTLSFVVVFLP